MARLTDLRQQIKDGATTLRLPIPEFSDGASSYDRWHLKQRLRMAIREAAWREHKQVRLETTATEVIGHLSGDVT